MFIMMVCLFITAWLPYLSKIVVAVAMQREGGYDNYLPREQQKRLTGFGARALAAHQNSFEALLLFGIAVLSAMAIGNTSITTKLLSILFVISRLAYHLAYLLNLATIRSLIWSVGFFSVMGIMCISMISLLQG